MQQEEAHRSTRRVRVVQLTGAMDVGGAEKVIAHLAAGLDQQRFQVTILCTRGIGRIGEQLREQGVDVQLTRPYVRARRHLAPFDLYAALKRLRPDVVHTHGEPPLYAAGPLGYLKLLPYWVHTFHYGNYPYTSAKRMWLERTLCAPASMLIAVAEQQRQSIIKHHKIAPERIRTLMNGVRPNPFIADEALIQAKRTEFGFVPDELVIGTVAVLSEQKGVPYLLQAAADVLRTHARVRFLIVGGGPLEQRLRAEASSMGFADRVHFAGWRDDVPQLLNIMDVFVMSSLWEAMPLTLLEAMAARRAMVVTDVGDNRRLADGSGVLVVPPADAKAIAAALTSLIADKERIPSLGAQSLQMFEQRYTVSHMVAAHERLYSSAVGDGSRKG